MRRSYFMEIATNISKRNYAGALRLSNDMSLSPAFLSFERKSNRTRSIRKRSVKKRTEMVMKA